MSLSVVERADSDIFSKETCNVNRRNGYLNSFVIGLATRGDFVATRQIDIVGEEKGES